MGSDMDEETDDQEPEFECPYCNGSGQKELSGATCQFCGGTGTYESLAFNPEEWPTIKETVETMLGEIKKYEKEPTE
jgi:hypothetical protein